MVLALALIVATIIIGGAVDARYRLPDLQPWHRYAPTSEVRAADIDDRFTIADYFKREERMFDEVRTHVEDVLPPAAAYTANRYIRASQSSPSRLDRNYNRSYEVVPETIRGGALLVHGLTDSPYSMRAIAEQLRADGYYSLALRMPGHGTVPAGLVSSGAADWQAAVRLGVRHVRSRIGAGLPLVLVGYSNGGALVTRYTLDTLEDASLPRPDRLVLVSPMIGVNPMARLARVISALGPIPYFEKARWLDVIPEYNPFKYNSFPANAGQQTFVITHDLQQRLGASRRRGAARPVSAGADVPVARGRDRQHAGHRGQPLRSSAEERQRARALRLQPPRATRSVHPARRLLAHPAAVRGTGTELPRHGRHERAEGHARSPGSQRRAGLNDTSRRIASGSNGRTTRSRCRTLRCRSRQMTLYTAASAAESPTGPVALGLLSPRGERSVLTVPVEVLMRVSSNPFFPYLAQRLSAWVNAGS